MRWFPAPALNHPVLLPVATVAIALSVPINFWAFTDNVPLARAVRDALVPDGLAATTHLHGLRFVHFLCLAYVALSLVARAPEAIRSPALAPVLVIGRQSLPAFVASVALAWFAGFILDVLGRGLLPTAAVNVFGLAAIYAVARATTWAKAPAAMIPVGTQAPSMSSWPMPRRLRLRPLMRMRIL
jgi:hypothetical protein